MSAAMLWQSALRRGGDARYLAVYVFALLLPAVVAYVPLSGFLQSLFDFSTRSKELVAWLDSPALIEVFRQLATPEATGIGSGLVGAFVVAAVVAPLLAGAALALAKTTGTLDFRTLLGGAASLYPRMVRTSVASLVPLGVAGAGAALALHVSRKASETATLESTATRAQLLAVVASIALFWLANVTVEAGRAYLGAEPQRRSALVAWWSGVRLLVRRPLRVLGLSFVTTLVGVGLALVVTAIRFRIAQSGTASIALAFVLAQLAVAALAWGRSSRLAGLVALIQADD
jgi:hypothetical protein